MHTFNLFSTLKREGGFTLNIETGESPEPGESKYAVAFSKTTERTFPLANFTPSDLVNFIAGNHDVLEQPGIFLGAWIDAGTVYLDCSLVTSDEKLAFRLARENEQIAVFCFENMESRTTDSYYAARQLAA